MARAASDGMTVVGLSVVRFVVLALLAGCGQPASHDDDSIAPPAVAARVRVAVPQVRELGLSPTSA